MPQISDQKRLELAYKKILKLEEKLKEHTESKEQDSTQIPVAVIGAACRYPGGVNNVSDLWNQFAKGDSSIASIPANRWDLAEIFSENRDEPNKTYCQYGSFFESIDEFDPHFFNISSKEADRMDPQQRLFLQGCWEAFEDAGYNDTRLSGVKCGVYAGSLNCDYTNVLNATPHDMDLFELMGTQTSILSARISYLLNLKGPSITIDTACSSSLIALELAVKAIQSGDIELALAGGVHLYITPNLYIMMSKAQMLSEDGKSKAFDNSANGFVPGEGMSVILLKRLDKAIADGDQIYGVILGGVSNQDGKTNGITAPSSLAQTQLQLEAYQKLNISPASIGYMEAHGTGTKLGDPIEFEALSKSFRHYTDQSHFCALGSSKTNFGHTLSAAGVTGVLKAILAMKHKKIPANLNFKTVNEHLDYEGSPFYINNELVDWVQSSTLPRRSAVSSYGFSGTNAHVVMEEAPVISVNQDISEPLHHLILVSAKTESALARKMSDLSQWLGQNPDAKLKDVSLTLMRGRCHFKYRTGFVISSHQDLISQMASWSPSKNRSGDDSGIASELIEKIAAENQSVEYSDILNRLLNLYISGQDADWQKILVKSGARNISLPTYPFEKEKYWIKEKSGSTKSVSQSSESAFSFVDANESTLEVQCYKKTFTGDEFYLKDHMINLRKILPGVAYLEMARSSGNLCNVPHKVTRIENVVWRNPIEVSDAPQTVKISLHPVDDQVDFQIFSTLSNSAKGTIHCTGRLSYQSLQSSVSRIDIDALRKDLPEFMSQKQCYDSFQEKGMFYGSSFKRILNLNFKNNHALASIEGRDDQKDIDALHPGIMDASMQAVLVLVNQQLGNLNKHYLPHSLESLEIHHPLTPRCYSVVTHREKVPGQDEAEYFDVVLTDEEGLVLLTVSGLKLVQIKHTMDSMANVADYLYYRNIFTPAPLNTLDPLAYNQKLSGKNKPSLLLMGHSDSLAQFVDLPLLQQYFSTTLIKITDGDFCVNHDSIELSLDKLTQVKQLLAALTQKNIKPEYIVWLDCRKESIDGESSNPGSTRLMQFQFAMIRELLQSKISSSIRFVSTEMNRPDSIQNNASATAFYKTLALENPGYLGKHLVFSDFSNGRDFSQVLVNELLNARFDPHLVMYKDKARYKNHIEQIADTSITPSDVAIPVFKQEAVYLLTGGLKGIGFALAKEIVSRHDVHLVLTGRSSLTNEHKQALDNLNASLQKGSVSYRQADVNSIQDLQNLKSFITNQHGKLSGILHCAGIKKDAFIFNKQDHEVLEVVSPKIKGTLNIDAVFDDQPLDFFILFSSIAAVFGNPGQADYAYANGFLDDFAVYRNSRVTSGASHGKTLSINWPLWHEGGMQLDEVTSKNMHDLFGMLPIDACQGLRSIEVCLQLEESSVMHMYGDQFKTAKALKNWIHEDKQQKISILNELTEEQRNRVKQETEHYFKLLISDEMKTPYEKLESDSPFEHFGMDSVVYMSLNKKLEESFGKISKTLFYEYQNIEAIAEYFVKNYLLQLIEVTGINLKNESVDSSADSPVIAAVEDKSIEPINFISDRFKKTSAPTEIRKNVDIAIVGISGRYPQADNLEEFWQNLVDKKDCIEEIPLDRWDHSAYFTEERGVAGKTYSRWGGFVKGHDEFDALFFNVSPKEASLVDPQERLFLQTSWQAIADAGYTGKALSNFKVGVYAGVMWSQYQLLGVDPAYETQGSVPESLISSVANRVSYYFDFHGPSIGLDTMCSSSLTAIHMACEAIKSGEIDYALAGGVNLIVHPNKYLRLAQGNFASSDGRCRSFGAGGTGYVPGEGVGVVLLKSLEQAIADKDHIYGVIKASHINHGGKTNGYTVPNPVQQAELIKKSLEKAKINPEAISYVEAHGTGTELGDPIEITGLSQAYSAQTQKHQFCALGSVKSNIGHLESAAGVSGLTKILLQLKHDLLVPSLHCDQVNPNIDLESSPFYLQKELTSWTGSLRNAGLQRTKRCAAISSFGAGGSNGHLIIEESPIRNKKIDDTKKPRIFIFSAKDESRLNGYINRFIQFLESEKDKASLDDIAYTLQTGRDMEVERLAVIADSHETLIQQLKTYQSASIATGIFNANASGANKENSFLPSGETGRDYINSLIKHREFSKIAALWVQGAVIDWALLQSDSPAFRIPMPAAPFQTYSFWINRRSDSTILLAASSSANLHPLIDRNIATFDQQAYVKTFKSGEDYLKHHRLFDKPLLPGAAYLEVARVAANLAGANNIAGFANIQWKNPLYVKDSVEAGILLEPSVQSVAFEIVAKDNWQQVYASGELLLENSQSIQLPNKKSSIDNLRESPSMKIDSSHFYEKLKNEGFQYSGIFKSLDNIVLKDKQHVASLNKEIKNLSVKDQHLVNISVIDAAFQSLFALIEQINPDGQTQYVPASCGSLLVVGQDLSMASDIVGQFKYQDRETENLVFDINICDANGNSLAAIENFVVAAISNRTLASNKTQSANKTQVAGAAQQPEIAYWVADWKAIPAESAVKYRSNLYIDFGKKQPAGFKGLGLIPDAQFIQVDANSIKADISQVNSWKRILNQLSVGQEKAELQIVIATAADNHGDYLLSEIFKMVKSLSISLMDNSSIGLVHICLLVEEHPFNPVKALTGMLKSLQQENSRVLCSSIEYPADISDEKLLEIINTDGARKKINPVAVTSRYRNNQFSVEQYVPLVNSENSIRQFKTGGSYLITGGAQGIGKVVAEYLAKEYQANLILVGRSGHNESTSQLLQALKTLGSETIYLSADVINRDEMQTVVEKSIARFGKINGIIHSAGCTRDSWIFNKTQADVDAVISPKIYGTRILDEVTAALDLDVFVVFSSLASIIGNAGQTDYALANNYLDLFAHDRNQLVAKGRRSGKTISINWPYWSQGGMKLSADNLQKLQQETGLAPLSNEAGLAALEFCLSQPNRAQIAVSYGDREMLNTLFQGNQVNPETTNLIQNPSVSENLFASASPEISTEEARSWIVNQIKTFISAETKWDINKILLTESFGTYGIDSVMTLSITKKLSGIFGDLPKTLFFEYQNVKSLSDYFVKQHIAVIAQKINQDNNRNVTAKPQEPIALGSLPGKSVSARSHNRLQSLMSKQPAVSRSNNSEPIAIIGLAGRYPDAENIQDFYQNLLMGKDSIREIPEWRWDNKKYFNKSRHATGKNYSQWGGFIENVDQFDPLFFNVSPTDAITMDPQERLFLESSWNCIEDAGYTKTQMANSRTGVFAGIMWSHYHFNGIDTEPVQSKKYPESNYASVANRVSYWFGFTGPSMTIDTMCSSSLTAIHLACEAIRNNQCEMAIAGGVNLTLHPYKYLQLSGSQFLSTDGRCRSFGDGGDGYVPGEGVGSVLLKPLSKALADKDHIYAVINASSINHGGKSNGYNVPNPQAQAALIREAINHSTINPADISYIEAHGTGTPLGDPIELQGLKKAFDGIAVPASCAIGSVKSNIGHLEAASGIAGLTKVILQMKAKKLFPSLHAETLNPNLDFSNSSFKVNTELGAWHSGNNRFVSGISSFGAGGSNAFLLVEENPSDESIKNANLGYPAVIVPLSARNEESLLNYMKSLVRFLSDIKKGNSLFANTGDFASIVKTLQTGKTIFQSRIALVVSSMDDLLIKLNAAINNDKSMAGIYRGFAETELAEESGAYDDFDEAINPETLTSIASYWVEGGNVNFAKVFKHIDGRKIPLPTYCFDKKSYWYKGNSISAEKTTLEETAYRGLFTNQFLLQSVDFERSTQNGLTFKSTFTMENEVVFNHQFEGRELLPGAAYIVMLLEALDSFDLKSKNQLTNIRWKSPIFVDSSVEVFTTIERHEDDCRYKIWTDSGRSHIHGVGELHHSDLPTSINWMSLDFNSLTSSINQNDFYRLFDQYGLAYSGPYKSIQNVRFNATEAIVDYSIKSPTREITSIAEVAIIDACLQIFVLFHERVSSEVKLPFSIDKLLFIKKPSLTGRLYVTQVYDDTGNVVVIDENGEVCIALEGINFQSINKPSVKPVIKTDKPLAVVDDAVEIRNQLTDQVRKIFANSLQLEDADLKNKVTFDQYGMESVKAMEITHELEKQYGKLPSTLLYEYQTIASLVDFIFTDKPDLVKKQLDVEKGVENLPVTNLPADLKNSKDNAFEFSEQDLKQKISQLADHEVDSLLNALLN